MNERLWCVFVVFGLHVALYCLAICSLCWGLLHNTGFSFQYERDFAWPSTIILVKGFGSKLLPRRFTLVAVHNNTGGSLW